MHTPASDITYPGPAGVKRAAPSDVLRGSNLTSMDCWNRRGNYRLAHHILVARQAGRPILTTEIAVMLRGGRSAQIAEYTMPESAIERAGLRGRLFVAAVAAARR
jgi:hypothetical protein